MIRVGYRVSFSVPSAYVDAMRRGFGQAGLGRDLSARLLRMGAGALYFEPMQDPTDEERFSVVTSEAPTGADPLLRVSSVEIVDVPESRPLPRKRIALDAGITPAEAGAIARALAVETNPRHLAGFAGTFEPMFPIAASKLRARSVAVQRSRGGLGEAPRSAASFGAVASMTVGACAFADAMGLPRDLALGEVRRAACQYVAEGRPLDEPLPNLPPEISGLGAACVKVSPDGTRAVVPELLAVASPTLGDPGYVTSSALQLANAAGKPSGSRVWNRFGAEEVYRSLEEPSRSLGDGIRKMRAKLALEKAEKTIQRGRWVRWYERTTR